MRLLYADESWLKEGFCGPWEWALVDNDGGVTGNIAFEAGHVPEHETTVLVLATPLTSTVVIKDPPPKARGHLLAEAAPYLIEDEVVDDVTSLHVILAPDEDADLVTAIVIRKDLMARLLAVAESFGFSPDRVTPEPLLLPYTPESLSLYWNGEEGYIRTSRFGYLSLDAPPSSEPPETLLRLCAGPDPAPPLHLFCANIEAIDIQRWSEALEVSLPKPRSFGWRQGVTTESAQQVNLLSGAFTPAATKRRWRRSLVATATLSTALFFLFCLSIIAEWRILVNEEAALDRAMEDSLRSAFPETGKIVDPPFQMRQKLNAFSLAEGGARDTTTLHSLLALWEALEGQEVAISRLEARAGELFVVFENSGGSDLNDIITRFEERSLKVMKTTPIQDASGDHTRFEIIWGGL